LNTQKPFGRKIIFLLKKKRRLVWFFKTYFGI
jgi:hypothetical protein